MSDDEDSSQEGVDAGMMGGLLPDESMKALSSGTAGKSALVLFYYVISSVYYEVPVFDFWVVVVIGYVFQ